MDQPSALRPLHRLVTPTPSTRSRCWPITFAWRSTARRHDRARRRRATVEDEAPTEELRQQFAATTRSTPPVERRYLVKDATVEKLGELLNHETGAARWDCRDEVSGFLHTLDRPGHENDRAFYCEAWNGTSAYTYDRIGRGTVPLT